MKQPIPTLRSLTRSLCFGSLGVVLASAALGADTRAVHQFDFGSGRVTRGFTAVPPETLYSKERGYGFEPGAKISAVDRGGVFNALRRDFCTSDTPFYFSVAVPEGNYRVTVTFGDRTGESVTTVKAELRRLMVEQVRTTRGKFQTRRFVVNVRTPRLPGAGTVRLKDREKTAELWAWDEKLTLEFNGELPAVCALVIEPVTVPTVFLLGDSTVCDQPSEPYASWGQMLTRLFGPGVAIANHAESGESFASSFGARRMEKVYSQLRPGDYVFLQYGHNDMKATQADALESYKRALQTVAEETRKRGGIPVFITSMHRRTFQGGRITNSLRDYPAAVRQKAAELKVPLIDLHTLSQELYEALGPEGSLALFKSGDGTHHNNYGAYQLAQCVVEGIKQNKLPLAKFLTKDYVAFRPGQPDPVKEFKVPASPGGAVQQPLGN